MHAPNTNRHHTDSHQTDSQHIEGHNIRMSRISHPRATVWATLLLVLVFVGFGFVAEANMGDAALHNAEGAICMAGFAGKH